MRDDFRERVGHHMARTESDIKTLFRDAVDHKKQMKAFSQKQDKIFNLIMCFQSAAIGLLVTIILTLITIYKS